MTYYIYFYISKFSESKIQLPTQKLKIILIIRHISAKAAQVLHYYNSSLNKKNKSFLGSFFFPPFQTGCLA
jgi:hypothetical protein